MKPETSLTYHSLLDLLHRRLPHLLREVTSALRDLMERCTREPSRDKPNCAKVSLSFGFHYQVTITLTGRNEVDHKCAWLCSPAKQALSLVCDRGQVIFLLVFDTINDIYDCRPNISERAVQSITKSPRGDVGTYFRTKGKKSSELSCSRLRKARTFRICTLWYFETTP